MAILNRGTLGGGRNAVGTVVLSRWKGNDVILARLFPSNPCPIEGEALPPPLAPGQRDVGVHLGRM